MPQTLSNRISEDAYKFFNEKYEEALLKTGSTREQFTKAKFMENMILVAGTQTEGYDPQTDNRIKELEHLNFRLSSENQIMKETNEQLKSKEHEVETVERPLLSNQLLVQGEQYVINLVRIIAPLMSKKIGREISPENMLLQLFWEDLKNPRKNNLRIELTEEQLNHVISLSKKNQDV